MAIKERLKEYLNYKHLSVRALERTCSLGNGVLLRISQSTSPTTLKKIEDSCDLNIDWLLTGEGEMLKSEESRAEHPAPLVDANGDAVPEQYTAWLVPMAAMGGSLVGFEESGVSRDECERVISPVANADLAITVYGDSMEPEYPNGSRVFVRRIYPDDFIAWGNAFVLDTTNGIIIKIVKKSDTPGCIRCESLNPSGRYPPFDVPMRAVRAIYRVLLCITMK